MNNEYTLSPSGRILSVGEDWNSHALNSGAKGLTSEHVVGRCLWDFVSGSDTRAFLNAIFFACRMDNQRSSMICRCDTPAKAQDFRFSVDPQPDETLVVSLSGLADLGNATSVVDLASRVDTTRCSMCCAFKLGENWIDPMTQPDTRYFARGLGVCPSCRETTAGRLRDGKSEGRGKLLRFRKPGGSLD